MQLTAISNAHAERFVRTLREECLDRLLAIGRRHKPSTTLKQNDVRQRISYYHSCVEIHPPARKHGIAGEDIEHATTHAMVIEDQNDDTRLYLGPSRNAKLLEVVTIVRNDGSELTIHAMAMRPKYRQLLSGG